MICKSCGLDKAPSLFYISNSSKCKECVKESVRANRKEKVEYYRAFDRARGGRPVKGYLKEYREKNPNKYKAHNIVNNAIRDGSLVNPNCCEKCGESKTVAHHADYLKPLNVEWLCQGCHVQWHVINGEGLNG